GRMFMMNRGWSGNMPQVVFLEIDSRDFLVNQNLYRIGFFVAPLFLSALIFILGYLYRKNLGYRREIESQRELARLGEIARTLSHEIKNPLSAIKLQTGILKKTVSAVNSGELTVIEEEVNRISLLTDRIRDFLKNPLGTPETIEIRKFIKDLIYRLKWDIEVHCNSQEDYYIKFDSERLRSVLENILKNALESSSTRVQVFLEAGKTRIEMKVIDNGEGIPDEIQGKIFDPFFTSKTKGSGIGLSISRRFVEAAGGKLEVGRANGSGTEVKILLNREKS
ncbi:MAG: HAMP domain-containing sensor histidine kinase, partial [Spirochaetota bacterium]